MAENGNSDQGLPQLNLVKPSRIYLHCITLRKWIQRLERSFELIEEENSDFGHYVGGC